MRIYEYHYTEKQNEYKHINRTTVNINKWNSSQWMTKVQTNKTKR